MLQVCVSLVGCLAATHCNTQLLSTLYGVVTHYGVASASRIDNIIGLFCKRAIQKRQYSAKETYNLIDPTDRSHPIQHTARVSAAAHCNTAILCIIAIHCNILQHNTTLQHT